MTARLMAVVAGGTEDTPDSLRRAERIFEPESGLQDSGHNNVQRLAVSVRRCIARGEVAAPGEDIQYVETVDEKDTALSEATGRLVVIDLIWE